MLQNYEWFRTVSHHGSADDELSTVDIYRHLSTGEYVVIKAIVVGENTTHINSSMDIDEDNHRRLREVYINHVVQDHGGHSSIVALKESFMAHSILYLVFEYCSGGDLLTHLSHNSTANVLNERQVVAIFRQLVSAVAYLHALDIAHCDLSLENILIDGRAPETASLSPVSTSSGTTKSDTMIKLCDFGLARAACSCSMRLGGVGKLYYMAPEMHLMRPYNALAADRWALGIILFMLLTGEPLFEEATFHDRNYRAFFDAQVSDPVHGVERYLRRDMQNHSIRHNDGTTHPISASAWNLLASLLQPAPRARLPLQNVLMHPFFDTDETMNVPATLTTHEDAKTSMLTSTSTRKRHRQRSLSQPTSYDHPPLPLHPHPPCRHIETRHDIMLIPSAAITSTSLAESHVRCEKTWVTHRSSHTRTSRQRSYGSAAHPPFSLPSYLVDPRVRST
jgi:serine/threonine protein kinase